MKNAKLGFIVLLIYCFIVLLIAPPALAQIDIGTWFGLQKGGDITNASQECKDAVQEIIRKYGRADRLPIICVFPTLGSLISTLLPNVYMIAGVILFILLIFGGFTYIVSAGQQKPEGVQQGKNAIGAALIGFLLIFASWWIIQIVEVITGIEIFEPGL